MAAMVLSTIPELAHSVSQPLQAVGTGQGQRAVGFLP